MLVPSFTRQRIDVLAGTPMNSNLVLIIDDDSAILEMIAELLRYEGYNIKTSSEGHEAVEFARTNIPALILLDLMMPEMSGWQVINALRTSPQTRMIPVVLLSARRDLAATARELDVASYLEKPFDLDALLDVIQGYVTPAQAHQQDDGKVT
jgi:CheY-like chemotaxis protein